jgi:hypothetical protein
MILDEMIAVMQAAKAGKQIQHRTVSPVDIWTDNLNPRWDWVHFEYRTKPDPRTFRLIRRGSMWEVDTPDYNKYATLCETIQVVEVL